MKAKDLYIFTAISMGVIVLSCSDDDVTGPAGNMNLITNSSFEVGGNASYDGWSIPDTLGISFSDDVPPNSGSWSIRITASSMPPPLYLIHQSIAVQQGEHRYKVSSWTKSIGIGGVIFFDQIRSDSLVVRNVIPISDTTWTQHSYEDTLTTENGDSLAVTLLGGISDLLPGATLFDLCRLERLD